MDIIIIVVVCRRRYNIFIILHTHALRALRLRRAEMKSHRDLYVLLSSQTYRACINNYRCSKSLLLSCASPLLTRRLHVVVTCVSSVYERVGWAHNIRETEELKAKSDSSHSSTCAYIRNISRVSNVS